VVNFLANKTYSAKLPHVALFIDGKIAAFLIKCWMAYAKQGGTFKAVSMNFPDNCVPQDVDAKAKAEPLLTLPLPLL
jgi:hypothetical protein